MGRQEKVGYSVRLTGSALAGRSEEGAGEVGAHSVAPTGEPAPESAGTRGVPRRPSRADRCTAVDPCRKASPVARVEVCEPPPQSRHRGIGASARIGA